MNTLLEEIYSTIIPSAPFIIVAYAGLLVVLFIWLFIQFRKQNKLEKQLIVLEEAAEERAGKQAK